MLRRVEVLIAFQLQQTRLELQGEVESPLERMGQEETSRLETKARVLFPYHTSL